MTDIVLRKWFYDELHDIFAAMTPPVPDTHVAWPGTIFDSARIPADETYWKPYMIVPEPEAHAVGRGARNIYDGVFQVSMFAPIGIDELRLINITSPITEHFKRGVQYSETGVFCVYCNQAYIAHSGRDKNRWQIVIRVKFRATILN